MFLHAKNPRARLTLWYVSLIAVLLVFAWGATSAMVVLDVQKPARSFRGRGDRDRRKPPFLHTRWQASIAGLLREQSCIEGQNCEFRRGGSASGSVLSRKDRLGDRSLGGIPVPGEGVVVYCPRSMRLSDG